MARSAFDFASFQGESTASRTVLVGEIRIKPGLDTFAQLSVDHGVAAHDLTDNVNDPGAVMVFTGGPAT